MEFSFVIEEHIGKIGPEKNGWQMELNRVAYNGRPAKFDLRSWNGDHSKMSKGITLTNEEFEQLRELLR
ncbi:MAG: PC4/YdbC family ssDNA-binding protein [Tissierellia bacterium]|nr:PC4/YdbC family ssDNA-binding protein [Tissierellia bacterium]